MKNNVAIAASVLSFLAGLAVFPAIERFSPSSSGFEVGGENAADAENPINITADDAQWGDPAAPVTIVEFSDFECPYCSRVEPTMDALRKKYGPKKLRIVWKHSPLPMHRAARGAHEASEVVRRLGGNEAFWKFHALAFANQRALSPENYERWAVESGVKKDAFVADFGKKLGAKKVDEDLKTSEAAGVRGTPNFLINGNRLVGANPVDAFAKVIDQELAEAAKLKAAGTKPEAISLELTKRNYEGTPKKDDSTAQDKPKEDTTVYQIPVHAGDPISGDKNAPVTIVMWSDYECPYCKRVEATLAQVRDEYKGKVRIVWKDNPLPMHAQAIPAAVLARLAYKKGGDEASWKAHDTLFENQHRLKEAGALKEIAESLGLNYADVEAASKSGTVLDYIEESQSEASDFGAGGTPHFFINGRRLNGAQPFEQFKLMIEGQFKMAEAQLKKGTPADKLYEELLKDGKKPSAPARHKVEAPTAANPSIGNKNAKIVIQVFSDFQCPYCAKGKETVHELMKLYPNDIRVVWRNFPLDFHKDAPLAAEAALEAKAQKGDEAFWAFHDKLFEVQRGPEGVTRPALEKIAAEQGVDMARFKKAHDENKHKAVIDADIAAGKAAEVRGTPAMFVGDYFVSGAQPISAYRRLIRLVKAGK